MNEKVLELENKIQELEERIAQFTDPSLISEDFLGILTDKGFMRSVGPTVLTYTNPSGREFWSRFVTWGNNQSLYQIDNYVDTAGVNRRSYVEFTADASSDVCTAQGHGLSDGQDVRIYTTGSLPGGLNTQSLFFVRDATTDTFKLAATLGGAAINITSNGSPFNYVVPV